VLLWTLFFKNVTEKYIKTELYAIIMISVEEMINLENETEKKGVSKLELMENAGKQIALSLGTNIFGKKVCVFCGNGNNGGMGLLQLDT